MAKRTGVQTNLASGDDVDTEAGTRGELNAAAVVRQVAEVVLRTVGVLNVDYAAIINELLSILQRGRAIEQVTGEANADSGWTYARSRLTRKDFADKPFLRVFGRVAEILLNHRQFQTITAGDVFRVFLVEISAHLEEHHRQNSPTGQPPSVSQADASTGEGRRTFNERMERLYDEDLIRPTVIRASGKKEKYVLTEDGQNMFDGWPDLADIPGLTYEGPATPEPRPRRRS